MKIKVTISYEIEASDSNKEPRFKECMDAARARAERVVDNEIYGLSKFYWKVTQSDVSVDLLKG